MGKKEEFERGHKFGHLTLIEELAPVARGASSKLGRMMKLECICGTIVEKQLKILRLTTRCCGCTHKKPGYGPSVSIGDIFKTNEGYEVKLIEYVKHSNLVVEFMDDFKAKVKTNVQACKQGSVANPYHSSVYGVACYGEPSDPWVMCKKVYMTWSGMLERVYVKEALDKRPTYRECSIVEEWHNFANFYEWTKTQKGAKIPKWQLDKDIIIKGNKVYSPETCAFCS